MYFNINKNPTRCSSMQSDLFTAKSLYMFRVPQHPSSRVLKTVTAASGTGHNIGTAPTWPVPDLATFEGSSCTDIMTCTGRCDYSF